MKRLYKRFLQWLWFGGGVLPEYPRFIIRKIESITHFTLERSDGMGILGFQFRFPFIQLQNRFIGQWIVQYFQRYYHLTDAWAQTHWREVPCYKNPCDLLIYQEIITEHKPDIIIECGTFFGGTALFLADVCELLDNGLVATIDIVQDIQPHLHKMLRKPFHRIRPEHDRILYIIGRSDTDPKVLEFLTQYITPDTKVMVILDSEHSYEHVKKQLEIYSPLVTEGQYLIVEDTNVGWLIKPEQKPGPLPAVREFLSEHSDFYIDYEKERHMLTMNPCGYLRKRIK